MAFNIAPKKRWPLLITITVSTLLVGFAISQAVLPHFISKSVLQSSSAPKSNDTTATFRQAPITPSASVRIKIPAIMVDAAIEAVALASDGSMDTPKGPAEVGWYSLGQRPGEQGSAVMTGHFGWRDSIPAVFDNLSKLQIGDKVYVEDKNKVAIIFVVRELRMYDKNEDAEMVFRSSDGKSHLNLITCEGNWDKNAKSYSNRLVVFTDKQ